MDLADIFVRGRPFESVVAAEPLLFVEFSSLSFTLLVSPPSCLPDNEFWRREDSRLFEEELDALLVSAAISAAVTAVLSVPALEVMSASPSFKICG